LCLEQIGEELSSERAHKETIQQSGDYVIVAVLSRLSCEFENIYPEMRRAAWNLAITITREHGLALGDSVRLLE